MIIPILEINLEHELIILNKTIIDKIVKLCHYTFIENFLKYDDLEVPEEKYILVKYRYVEFCLNKIIASDIEKKEIESWLEQELGIIWKNIFKKIWIAFIEKQILVYEFIKQAFKTIGEIRFIDILDSNALIDKCRRSNAKKFEY
ncbi:MAG: hypothetical protein JXA99_13635 [Candidatus Lokiarchaeota archaeon]|nr:hypothetical protein [Candidatus Lokiarchaeota archaeon]